MRKVFISLLIILVSLITLNMAALFMHKKSLNAALLTMKSKLEEQGTFIEFTEPKFKNYIAWKPVFSIKTIDLRRGNKNDRAHFVLKDLLIKISTFNKKVKLNLLEDITLKEQATNKERNFIYKVGDGVVLEIKLTDSIDLFLRDLDNDLFSKIKSLHLKNDKFATYELKQDELSEQLFNAVDSFVFIERSNDKKSKEKENYKLEISGGMKEGFYQPNSNDENVKALVKFGKASGDFKVTYTHLMGHDLRVTEEFYIHKISSVNDVFALNISGNGLRNETQRMPEWNLTVEAINYKEMIRSYFDILNYSVKEGSKEQTEFATKAQVEKIVEVFSKLPKAKITGKDMSFNIEKSSESDFKVGGIDITTLSNHISNIFVLK